MFCKSEAATAICTTTAEQHMVSSSTTIRLGSGRAIDRHNPIIPGSRRSLSSSSSSSSSDSAAKEQQPQRSGSKPDVARKSTCSLSDHQAQAQAQTAVGRKSSASLVDSVRKSSSCKNPGAYFTPDDSKTYFRQPNSERALAVVPDKVTRHPKAVRSSSLKNDAPLFVPAESDKVTRHPKPVRSSSLKNDAPLFVPTSDKYYSPFSINSDHQVVVVRVSLHCKGCAGKVKKHISRLEGVSYFNVDFDAKKVIVVGNVTLLEVIACISKVRTAQLLPSEKPNSTTLAAPWKNDAKQFIG